MVPVASGRWQAEWGKREGKQMPGPHRQGHSGGPALLGDGFLLQASQEQIQQVSTSQLGFRSINCLHISAPLLRRRRIVNEYIRQGPPDANGFRAGVQGQ